MNREDIIRMAREAGDDREHTLPSDKAFLERFAALVAAAEQEKIAQAWDTLHDQYMADPLRRQMPLSYELVANLIRGCA